MSRYNKTSWIKSFHWYECQFNLVQLSVLKRIPGPRFSSYNYAGSASCCLATVAWPHTHSSYSAALQQCNCRGQELYRILDIYIAFRRLIEIELGMLYFLYLLSDILLHLLKANCPICWVVPCLRLASAQRSRDQSPTFKSRYQTDTKPFCPKPGPARCPAW